MVTFGIHPYIWTARWDTEALKLIDRARSLGFQGMEIPLIHLDILDVAATRRKLDEAGFARACSTGLSAATDVTSSDPDIRQNGLRYLKAAVKAAHELASTSLSGVIYAPFGKNVGRGPTADEWGRCVDVLHEVAQYARFLGLTLGIEPVNRYETHFINTAEAGKRLIRDIGEPNVKIHLDTYHMNIEEKDFYKTILSVRDDLFYLHLCENDRGIPGTGHVDWKGVFKALAEIGYEGMVTIESFVSTIPEMAAATCIWRQLAPSADDLAREGLKFLRATARDFGLAD